MCGEQTSCKMTETHVVVLCRAHRGNVRSRCSYNMLVDDGQDEPFADCCAAMMSVEPERDTRVRQVNKLRCRLMLLRHMLCLCAIH